MGQKVGDIAGRLSECLADLDIEGEIAREFGEKDGKLSDVSHISSRHAPVSIYR